MKHHDLRSLSLVASYEPQKLQGILSQFILDRMEMDKKLNAFLDNNVYTMGENTETPIWKEYKSLNHEYSELIKNITVTQFYINRK